MLRFVPVLCLLLAPLAAAAQQASSTTTAAVSKVANCLATGLPDRWQHLQVIIQLSQPMAPSGGVLYMVTLPDGRVEPFMPCDPRLPPIELLGLRDGQPENERGWTKLVLTMQPDASFGLKYDYPAK
jgi:hypothetical protein